MNIAIERVLENNEVITWMFGLVFFLLTCVQLLFSVRLKSLLSSFFSKYYFLDFQTALQDTFSLFNVLLFLIQNLILSIFLFKACVFLEIDFDNDLLFFLKLFTSLTMYFLFQYIVGKVFSYLFDYEDRFNHIHVLKFSYMKVVSFGLLPFLLTTHYFPYFQIEFLSYGTLVVLCILLTIRVVFIISFNNKWILQSLFYFILYICSLEIAPLLIINKLTMVN
jgi:hypothetical protein